MLSELRRALCELHIAKWNLTEKSNSIINCMESRKPLTSLCIYLKCKRNNYCCFKISWCHSIVAKFRRTWAYEVTCYTYSLLNVHYLTKERKICISHKKTISRCTDANDNFWYFVLNARKIRKDKQWWRNFCKISEDR